jgi:hypothetical protein
MPPEPLSPRRADAARQPQPRPQRLELVDVDEGPDVVVVALAQDLLVDRARCCGSFRSERRGSPLQSMCNGNTTTPLAFS